MKHIKKLTIIVLLLALMMVLLPAKAVSKVQLEINGQKITYDNGEKVMINAEYERKSTEFRAVWVSPATNDIAGYTSMQQYKEQIYDVLDKMDYYNLNVMIFHVRIMNDAIYKSKYNKWSVYYNENPDWDALPWIIEECHKRGIEFHAWMNPYRVTNNVALSLEELAKRFDRGNPASNPKNMLRGSASTILNPGLPEVQSFLVSNAMFFVKKFHIDGIRMDAVASMLYLDYGKNDGEWHPNSFGTNINLEAVAFLKKCNDAIHQAYPEVLMIAEESTAYPKITVPTEYGGLGFDYKWNMGWMNDTLSYIKDDPIYRQYHHDKLTFQMTYIYSEHYILPLSHDEVVHMKGSLINKMPGSYEQKFAGLKVYLTYMMTHPGKKLLFMGGEIGQFREWNEDREIDWSVLQYQQHQGLQKYNEHLNNLYKTSIALYENDYNWDGFKWLVVNDNTRNVLSYARMSQGEEMLVILNFSFNMWFDYKISDVENGEYEIILASDDEEYGGTHHLKGQKYKVENNELVISIPYSSGIILRKVK